MRVPDVNMVATLCRSDEYEGNTMICRIQSVPLMEQGSTPDRVGTYPAHHPGHRGLPLPARRPDLPIHWKSPDFSLFGR